MKLYPEDTRGRWHLLLFPFKAYLLTGPGFFIAWDALTAGHRFRGAYATAATVIAFGFIGCLLAFVLSIPVFLLIGWRLPALKCGFYAMGTFLILLLWLPMCAQS